MAPLSDGSILGPPPLPSRIFNPLFVPDLVFPWAFQPVLPPLPLLPYSIASQTSHRSEKSSSPISEGIKIQDIASSAIELCRDVVRLFSTTNSRRLSKRHKGFQSVPKALVQVARSRHHHPLGQHRKRSRQRPQHRTHRHRPHQVTQQVWRPIKNPSPSSILRPSSESEPIQHVQPDSNTQCGSVLSHSDVDVVVDVAKSSQLSPIEQPVAQPVVANSKLRASAPSFIPNPSSPVSLMVSSSISSPKISFSSLFGIPNDPRSDQELLTGVAVANPYSKFAKPSALFSMDDSTRVSWDDESGTIVRTIHRRTLPRKYISKTLDDFGDSPPKDVNSLSDAIKMWKLEARRLGITVRKRSTRNKKIGFPVAKKPGKSINYRCSRDDNFYYY